MKFWDTSAIVPLCVFEPSTPALRALQEEDPDQVVWWGTRLESLTAVARSVRTRRLDPPGERECRTCFSEVFETILEVEPVEAVRARAEQLVTDHPLRAADALQLAAALIWARMRPAGMEFVSLDQRLRDAAYKEGFSVLPTTLT